MQELIQNLAVKGRNVDPSDVAAILQALADEQPRNSRGAGALEAAARWVRVDRVDADVHEARMDRSYDDGYHEGHSAGYDEGACL